MQKRKYRKKDYLLCVTIYIICVMAAFIIRKQEFISTGIFFDKQAYWGITSVIESICIFIFFQQFKEKSSIVVRKISECTFGIYLIHPLILTILNLWGIDVNMCNPIISIPIVLGVTFVLSALCTMGYKMLKNIK